MPGTSESEVVVSGIAGGLPDRAVRAAVRHVLRCERRRARIAVTFLGKRQMRQLNADFLRHDQPTDVLAFALQQPDGSQAGDIYICRYVAARNARAHHATVRQELQRLIVHGTLHVLGWNHPDGASRSRSAMWRQQERLVAGLR
ncbi:MAG: rRNA maturation RNase YbeY [Gemmatimonadales bacterium]